MFTPCKQAVIRCASWHKLASGLCSWPAVPGVAPQHSAEAHQHHPSFACPADRLLAPLRLTVAHDRPRPNSPQLTAACRYSATLTGALGGTLSSFVVDNQRDLKTLTQLAHQVGWKEVTVFTMSFGLPQHSIGPRQEPAGDLVTAMRVVQVRSLRSLRSPVRHGYSCVCTDLRVSVTIQRRPHCNAAFSTELRVSVLRYRCDRTVALRCYLLSCAGCGHLRRELV